MDRPAGQLSVSALGHDLLALGRPDDDLNDPGCSARYWLRIYKEDIRRELALRGQRLSLMFASTPLGIVADRIASFGRVPAHLDLETYIQLLEAEYSEHSPDPVVLRELLELACLD
jgi:hypothetical protein